MTLTGRAPPIKAQRWQHVNHGDIYVVLHIANETATDRERFPRIIVYQNEMTKEVYARPLHDWHRSFKFFAMR